MHPIGDHGMILEEGDMYVHLFGGLETKARICARDNDCPAREARCCHWRRLQNLAAEKAEKFYETGHDDVTRD